VLWWSIGSRVSEISIPKKMKETTRAAVYNGSASAGINHGRAADRLLGR